MLMNRFRTALFGSLVAVALAGGCGQSTVIAGDDAGGSGSVQPGGGNPGMGGGGSGGTPVGGGGTPGKADAAPGGGSPAACVAGGACTVDCAQSCSAGGSVPCTCTSGRYVCAMCRGGGPTPPGGGGVPRPDAGVVAPPMMCPANAQGARCDAAQPVCVQGMGGGLAGLCLCRQGTWTCLGGGGGGGGGAARDASAPADAARVMACPANAQNGAPCPAMGTACVDPTDGAVSGCLCLAAGAMTQWRCNR